MYRYHWDDGLPGHEGGFHLCTGWMAECYALLGRTDDARALLEQLCATAGPLGLMSEEYDPATDAWGAPRARMPSARSAMSSGTWSGKIYVTGGEGQDYVSMFAFRALEAYDPGTNSWTVLPNMPVGRHGLAGAVVGNRLHMVSGDVQSAGTGVHVHTESHDAYELDGGKK